MVAPHNISLRGMLGRGGKSELHRAGWSVMRTVPSLTGWDKESATERIPPREIGVTAISRGKGEKVR
jgi:hypothetical protein